MIIIALELELRHDLITQHYVEYTLNFVGSAHLFIEWHLHPANGNPWRLRGNRGEALSFHEFARRYPRWVPFIFTH